MPNRFYSLNAWVLALCSWLFVAVIYSTPANSQPKLQGASLVKPSDARLTVELQPAELTVDPAIVPRAPFVVVAHNLTGSPVSQADLDFFTPDGLVVEVASRPNLPSTGDLIWTCHVNATENAPVTTKILAELRYVIGSNPSSAIALATATVTEAAPPDPIAAVKVTLTPSEGMIDRFTPLNMHLQFDNPSKNTVIVKSVRLYSPDYAELSQIPDPVRIGPGAAVSIPLKLAPKDRVVAGVYPLVLGYELRLPDRPDLREEGSAAQGKLTVGMPGLSEAMQLFGIPSLLLLPGALTSSRVHSSARVADSIDRGRLEESKYSFISCYFVLFVRLHLSACS